MSAGLRGPEVPTRHRRAQVTQRSQLARRCDVLAATTFQTVDAHRAMKCIEGEARRARCSRDAVCLAGLFGGPRGWIARQRRGCDRPGRVRNLGFGSSEAILRGLLCGVEIAIGQQLQAIVQEEPCKGVGPDK